MNDCRLMIDDWPTIENRQSSIGNYRGLTGESFIGSE